MFSSIDMTPSAPDKTSFSKVKHLTMTRWLVEFQTSFLDIE